MTDTNDAEQILEWAEFIRITRLHREWHQEMSADFYSLPGRTRAEAKTLQHITAYNSVPRGLM